MMKNISVLVDNYIKLPKLLTYAILSVSLIFGHMFAYQKSAYLSGIIYSERFADMPLWASSIYTFMIFTGLLHALALMFLFGFYYNSAMRFFDFRSLDKQSFTRIASLAFTLANIPLGLISLLYYRYAYLSVFSPMISFACYTLTALAAGCYLTMRYRMRGERARGAIGTMLVPFFLYYAVMFLFGGGGILI